MHEVDRRLRATVLPALEPVCMNLTIRLELEDERAVAALSDEGSSKPDSFLGLDPLGRPGAGGRRVRRIVLYRGRR